MAFSVEEYLVHVESPEITPNDNKRAQVIECIMKYFDMHPSANLSKERLSCKTYVESILTDQVLKYMEFGEITHEEAIAKITAYHDKCN